MRKEERAERLPIMERPTAITMRGQTIPQSIEMRNPAFFKRKIVPIKMTINPASMEYSYLLITIMVAHLFAGYIMAPKLIAESRHHLPGIAWIAF
jgi:hypothetical protein